MSNLEWEFQKKEILYNLDMLFDHGVINMSKAKKLVDLSIRKFIDNINENFDKHFNASLEYNTHNETKNLVGEVLNSLNNVNQYTIEFQNETNRLLGKFIVESYIYGSLMKIESSVNNIEGLCK